MNVAQNVTVDHLLQCTWLTAFFFIRAKRLKHKVGNQILFLIDKHRCDKKQSVHVFEKLNTPNLLTCLFSTFH